MKRGEIWIITGRDEFLTKPRPAIILQGDLTEGLDTVTVCPLTTDQEHGVSFRLPISPSERNGLDFPSLIMVDRIATVRRARLNTQIGELEADTMRTLGRAIALFLGLNTARDDR